MNEASSQSKSQPQPEVPQERDALIYLFEKLGVPLMNAIAAVQLFHSAQSKGAGGADGEGAPDAAPDAAAEARRTATDLASLLNRTVSLSTALSEKLELAPGLDHKHRLDIAAVASLMVAHQYALMARIPDEKEIPKITASLESVLSFADYFTDSGSASAADQDDPDALLVGCLDAAVPLVQAIGRFSFGRNEKTLLSDILSELGKRTENLVKALGEDMGDRKITRQKIRIFKGCAQLLTLSYESEMNNLISAQQSSHKTGGSGDLSGADGEMDKALERMWDYFDSRVALLRTVLGFVNNHFTADPASAAEKDKSAPKEKAKEPGRKGTASRSDIDVTGRAHAPGKVGDKDDDNDQAGQDEGSGDEGDKGDFNPMSFFTGK